MASSINIDLSKAVNQLLEEYGDNLHDAINDAIVDVSKDAVDVIKAKSTSRPPARHNVRTGRYAKGWKAEIIKEAYGMVKVILHNRTDWMLTHLLNNGYYSVREKTRKPGDGHIDAAEKEINEMLIKKVEESLK